MLSCACGLYGVYGSCAHGLYGSDIMQEMRDDIREISSVCSFPRAAVIKYHSVSGSQQQKCIRHRSGSQKSENKALTGSESFWRLRSKSSVASSVFCWHTLSCECKRQSLPPSPHSLLSVSIPPHLSLQGHMSLV